MRWLTYALFLLLLPFVCIADITLDTRQMTLPEALDSMKAQLNPESTLYGFTYSLPRNYPTKGNKGNVRFKNFQQSNINELLLTLADIYRVSFKNVDGHLTFYRDPRDRVADQISLLEAIGATERYAKAQSLDLTAYTLNSATLNFSKEESYWWHLRFARNPYGDGAANTLHFFVYNDLFVENYEDARSTLPKQIATEDVLTEIVTPAP